MFKPYNNPFGKLPKSASRKRNSVLLIEAKIEDSFTPSFTICFNVSSIIVTKRSLSSVFAFFNIALLFIG